MNRYAQLALQMIQLRMYASDAALAASVRFSSLPILQLYQAVHAEGLKSSQSHTVYMPSIDSAYISIADCYYHPIKLPA